MTLSIYLYIRSIDIRRVLHGVLLRRTLVCLCAVVMVGGKGDTSRVVELVQGPVRGYKDSDGDIFVFYGVPYATAPTGPNKFGAPLPPPTNQDILDAVDKGLTCPQVPFNLFTDGKNQQEDCLIANIFVPDTEDNKLPVLIEVHGGGFEIGLGNWKKPKHLIRAKNMIVVSFNYRLGVHGFLCLGTKDIPGNAGMKDQVALLRWVKNNIAAFGGNPDDVTIGGGSAGGASVDLLMLSKAANGLFNKAIPASGSNLAAFSIQTDPLENAKELAKQLNFTNTDDIYALEQFYKSTPLAQLIVEPYVERTDTTFLFAPCIERDIGQEVFLDEDPLSVIKNGRYEKVPLLIGFANMEGLLRIKNFETWKDGMNENFSNYLPADLIFDDEEQKRKVVNDIKQYYFGGEPISYENILSYVNFFTDIMFSVPALRSVELHVKNGHDKVYLYEYSFTDDDVALVPHTIKRGANHCAQLMAVMDGKNLTETDETNISEEYKNMKSIMRELWSNFITTGKPASENSSLPSWPPAGVDRSPYMSLGRTIELKDGLMEKRFRFWDELYDKYYKAPSPPPTPPARHTEL